MQIITLHNVNGLELVIKHSSDVVELDKLLDGGEYSRDGVSRTLCHLLDDVLALEKFIGYQLIIFFLEESEHVRPGVIDGVCHAISDIREIHFLDCGNYLLHKSLFESSHFLKQAHLLGVRDSHVRIHVEGCTIQDDERTRAIWVDE